MATRLGHIDLVSRLSQGSHLFIPPLTFDRAAVLSATHLASLIRSSGRDAQVLAHPSWIQHLMMEAEADIFLLPDEYAYHLQERPETTWLWGLSSPRQHSQELRNFMLGLSTVQVLDWTGERRRPMADAIHQTPFLGGLTELSYSLSRELWPVHNWDDHYLGEGLASFMERYPLLTRDAPLIHLFGQLTLPHRPEEPLPKLSELLREDDWALYCYRDLSANQAALIERVLFDLFIADPADHIIVLIERDEGKYTILSIHSEVEDDLKARSWIRAKIEQAANGSDFIVDEPKKLLEKLMGAMVEKEIVEAELSESPEASDEEDIQAPEGVEVAEDSNETGEEEHDDAPAEVEEPKKKAPKLRLDPWPFPLYLGNHFSFGCADPQWAVERDQRLEAARELEPDEPTEEEEEEERRLLEWDSMQLLRRIQALKRPPIRLRWQDLKAAHLPVVELTESDLKSTFDAELDQWEQKQAIRMKALLEAQAKEALRIAEEEALRELAEKTRREEEEKAAEEERLRKEAEEERAQKEAEEKAAEEERLRKEAEEIAAEEERLLREAEEQAAEEERLLKEAEEQAQEEDKPSESEAIPDILHQQGEGWGAQKDEEDEDDDESLLRAFDQLEEEHGPKEDEWDDEKGIDDSEGIEHPSLDMFMEEEEEEDPEAILAKLEGDEPELEEEEALHDQDGEEVNEEDQPELEEVALDDQDDEKVDIEDQPEDDEATVSQNEDNTEHDPSQLGAEIDESQAEEKDQETIEPTPEPEALLEELEALDNNEEATPVEEENHEDLSSEPQPDESSEKEAELVENTTNLGAETSQEDHEIGKENEEEDLSQEAAIEEEDPTLAEESEPLAEEIEEEDASPEIEEEDSSQGAFSEPALSSEEILSRLEESFEIEEDALPEIEEKEESAPEEEKVESSREAEEESPALQEESSSQEATIESTDPSPELDEEISGAELHEDESSMDPNPEEASPDITETVEDSSSPEEVSIHEVGPENIDSVAGASLEDEQKSPPQSSETADAKVEESDSQAPKPQPSSVIGRRSPTGYINPYLWDHHNTLQDVFDEVRQTSVLRASDWPYLVMLIVVGLFAWINDLPMI